MSQTNPLQKYFRQPKVYISLPSKGLFYKPGTLIGDYNHVPIFSMTGMDEIIMKTPDGLFSGVATVALIESCCPYIKEAGNVPSIDIDSLLIAIRIATVGDKLPITHKCSACETENNYDIELGPLLDYFSSLQFSNTVKVTDEITIKICPLSYAESTELSLENFKLQKTLFQLSTQDDDTIVQEKVNEIYKALSELQLKLFTISIESIQLPDGVVQEKEYITEWLRNVDREIFGIIKDKLEKNKESWTMPRQTVVCESCSHSDSVDVTLDQSSFFV
jgi:hypothetical protein